MAVVYPEPAPASVPPASTGGRLVGFAEQHIVLAAVFLIGLALAVGYLVNKVRGTSSSSSTSSSTQQPQTLYVPTSNTFETVTTTTNNPPSSGLPPPSPTGPPTLKPPSQVTVGAPGGPPAGDSLAQIAALEGETTQQLYTANPFLGNPVNGNYVAGGDYNPNDPGNANGLQLNIGSGDPFSDGHLSPLRTIFSMNHGIAHHLNTVLGA